MKLSSSHKITILLGVLLAITIIGCYQPSEGCIESWATNYDILADDLCDDCCTRPKVNADIAYYINDSTTYSFGDTIVSSSGRIYSLLNINMMLLDFELGSNGIQIEEINDTIEIDDIVYEEDFGFSTGQGGAIALTEYEEPYAVDSIAFSQGLIPEWQDTTIFGRDNTTIALAIDSLYIDAADIFTRMSCSISLDTMDIDTLHLVSTSSDTLRYGFTFDNIELNLGSSTTLEIKVDLFSWFDDVIGEIDTNDQNVSADILATTLEDYITIE
jgi:hypothetical protein